MKHKICLLIFFIILPFLIRAQEKNYKVKGAPLPPFIIEKTSGGTFTNLNLKAGKPLMIMIFSPECDHCEYIVDSLKNIVGQFKNTQFMLVAEARNKKLMTAFVKKTGIQNNPLFKITGTDKENLIYYIYTNKVLPQITFYDSKQKLVTIFDGNYSFSDVKKLIQ